MMSSNSSLPFPTGLHRQLDDRGAKFDALTNMVLNAKRAKKKIMWFALSGMKVYGISSGAFFSVVANITLLSEVAVKDCRRLLHSILVGVWSMCL